jgi:cell division protein FtsL
MTQDERVALYLTVAVAAAVLICAILYLLSKKGRKKSGIY